MPSISSTAVQLLAAPRPVLSLDTCELLAAVQCLPQHHAVHVEALSILRAALVNNPDRVLLVLTDLVLHEWGQNMAAVQEKARQFLSRADLDSRVIHDAWTHLKQPLPSAASTHASTALVAELTALAQEVMAAAWVIDREPVCVDRALGRVLAKARPSQRGQIKDSLHLEHYLELARQLQSAGFTERRVFVSSNKDDFWGSTSPVRIHPSLEPDLNAVGLEFFGDLRSAVGYLNL